MFSKIGLLCLEKYPLLGLINGEQDQSYENGIFFMPCKHFLWKRFIKI